MQMLQKAKLPLIHFAKIMFFKQTYRSQNINYLSSEESRQKANRCENLSAGRKMQVEGKNVRESAIQEL